MYIQPIDKNVSCRVKLLSRHRLHPPLPRSTASQNMLLDFERANATSNHGMHRSISATSIARDLTKHALDVGVDRDTFEQFVVCLHEALPILLSLDKPKCVAKPLTKHLPLLGNSSSLSEGKRAFV